MIYPAGVGAQSVVQRLFGSLAADDVRMAHGFACRGTVNNAATSSEADWRATNREKVARGA
jgi:hypothetical protein